MVFKSEIKHCNFRKLFNFLNSLKMLVQQFDCHFFNYTVYIRLVDEPVAPLFQTLA